MARLTVAEAQQRAQEWREWRHEREWGVLEWLSQPGSLGLGVQPPQASIELDPDAPMLMRHVVPEMEPAPKPKAKPKPKPRPAGARAAAMMPAPQPQPRRTTHPPGVFSAGLAPLPWQAKFWSRASAPAPVPLPLPQPALTWDRMAAWEGGDVQPSAPYQCPDCPTRVTLTGPLPPGRYRIICPVCIYGFDGAVT